MLVLTQWIKDTKINQAVIKNFRNYYISENLINIKSNSLREKLNEVYILRRKPSDFKNINLEDDKLKEALLVVFRNCKNSNNEMVFESFSKFLI